MKRVFDIVMATIGLIVLSPLFLLVAVLIKIDSHGPIFFRQERIGKRFRPFLIYKFRTMVENAEQIGSKITYRNDPRITRIGQFLRKTKIDELPQIINVFKGEMSLVGPRPEVRQYVEIYRQDYETILTVRPGITDLASLKYPDEEALLGHCNNPQEEYLRHVLPDKINLNKESIKHSSFFFDLTLILKTLLKLFEYRIPS
jgi:lipopolysaccharide/colanic/teichoic acid biosynthesis glycosyltransferase